MKHAAHKAANDSRQSIRVSRTLFTPIGGSHSVKMVRKAQKMDSNGAIIGLEKAVADKLNEVAPQTRRAMREAARAADRRSRIIFSTSLVALVGTAATAVAMNNAEKLTGTSLATTTSTTSELTRVTSSTVSRSEERAALSSTTSSDTEQTTADGQWSVGDSNAVEDASDLSHITASNPVVASLLEEDYDDLPDDFDPDHATGDSGCAYDFSECTWWAYTRRQELGLPVGSYFGNGCMWANSARALGYWVDNTPRHVGDIIVFAAGQEGASSTYGHVAIVEKINDDGSIETSECGSSMNGVTYSRTITNVSDFEYIHY